MKKSTAKITDAEINKKWARWWDAGGCPEARFNKPIDKRVEASKAAFLQGYRTAILASRRKERHG